VAGGGISPVRSNGDRPAARGVCCTIRRFSRRMLCLHHQARGSRRMLGHAGAAASFRINSSCWRLRVSPSARPLQAAEACAVVTLLVLRTAALRPAQRQDQCTSGEIRPLSGSCVAARPTPPLSPSASATGACLLQLAKGLKEDCSSACRLQLGHCSSACRGRTAAGPAALGQWRGMPSPRWFLRIPCPSRDCPQLELR
jgi:hypothetical protein